MCPQIRQLSVVKTTLLPKSVYRFSASTLKIPPPHPPLVFAEIDKLILKFIRTFRGPKVAK